MTTTPKALRSRTLTSAKRSLGLIEEMIIAHRKILDDGGVPDAGFTASVTKYEESRVRLLTLSQLADGEDADSEEADSEVTVRQDDLELLLDALNEFVPPEFLASEPGSPYHNIVTALGVSAPQEQPAG